MRQERPTSNVQRPTSNGALGEAWDSVAGLLIQRCLQPAALRWVNPGTLDAALLAVAEVVTQDAPSRGFVFVTSGQRTGFMERWLADNAAEARREADAVTLAWAMQEDALLWIEDGFFARALFAVEAKPHAPWTPERQLLVFLTAKLGNMPGVAEFGDGAAMREAAAQARKHHAPIEVAGEFCALVAFVLGRVAEFALRFIEGPEFVPLTSATVERMGRALAGMLRAGARGETLRQWEPHWWVRARTVPFAVPVMVLAARMEEMGRGRDNETGRSGQAASGHNLTEQNLPTKPAPRGRMNGSFDPAAVDWPENVGVE